MNTKIIIPIAIVGAGALLFYLAKGASAEGYSNLVVRVYDDITSNPIPGASVDVGGVIKITNSYGSVTFTRLVTEPVTVIITATGYISQTFGVDLLDGDNFVNSYLSPG